MWILGALAGKSGYIIAFLLIALVLAVFLLPQIRQSVLKLRSEEVTIASAGAQDGAGEDSGVKLDIITVLGKTLIREEGKSMSVRRPLIYEVRAATRRSDFLPGILSSSNLRAFRGIE